MERSKEYSQSSVFLVCGPRDGREYERSGAGYELEGNKTSRDGNAVMRYASQNSHAHEEKITEIVILSIFLLLFL